jgi:hypothetical protein
MSRHRNDGAIFFVRHYNDVDHMAPVAWRCAQDTPTRIIVTNKAAERHPILATFDRESDVEVARLRDYTATATDVDGRTAIADRVTDPAILFEGVGDRPAICLDWDYAVAARRIAESAQEHDLVALSLPHGDAPYVNLLINLNDLDGDLARGYERASMFDHTAVPNDVCAIRYRTLPRDRLHVLGSPRYCRAWMARLPTLVDDAIDVAPRQPGVLRVGVFLRNSNFPIHWEELAKALALIQAAAPCEIVVKHHTRDKRMAPILKQFPVLEAGDERIEISPTHEGSGAVLDRVDLVVDLGTSIAFEAVLRGLPVLELEYVHANRSTIAEYLPRTEMRTRDELVAAVAAAHSDPSALRATAAEAAGFREAIIEPRGSEVLENYYDLARNAAPA